MTNIGTGMGTDMGTDMGSGTDQSALPIADFFICGGLSPRVVSASSTEFLLINVVAIYSEVIVNPTDLVVEVAAVISGSVPGDSDFVAATWESVTTFLTTLYNAKWIATGLTASTDYDVWIQINDATNVIRQYLGVLEVRV